MKYKQQLLGSLTGIAIGAIFIFAFQYAEHVDKQSIDKTPAVSSYSWLSVSPDVSKEEAIKKCEELVNANKIVMESKYGNPVISPILYTDPVTKQSIVHTCEDFFNWISQSKLEYCQVQ